MPNYSALAITASRLIQAAGRDATLVRLSEASASPTPWNPTTPRSAEATQELKAAFVDPGGLVAMGFATAESEGVRRSAKALLVAAADAGSFDVTKTDEVVDGDARWQVVQVWTLKPGDVALVYALGVRR